MSVVVGLIKDYVDLYQMLDRMLAGEHGDDALRRDFARKGKAFLDAHFELAKAPYKADAQSDFALLRSNAELRKEVARVMSAFALNNKVGSMIPGAGKHKGRELDKVTELLNSPERLQMLRLIRNPAMEELGANATVRSMMKVRGFDAQLAVLDKLNAADKDKPKADELDTKTRLKLVRQAITAPEENEGALGGFFKRAASALVPDILLKQINDMAEDAYVKAQNELDAQLEARVPKKGLENPRP